MRRRLTPELMDDPGAPVADLGRALGYIRAVNRRLGGVDALLRHLRKWSNAWTPGEPVSLLDVGTGSADLPIAARRWARSRGVDLRITALDRHEQTIRVAQEQVAIDNAASPGAVPIDLIRADALEMDASFAPASFDYVHAGLFLHHLPEAQVVRVLASMWRLAQRGIVWNDLVRSSVGYGFIWTATLGQPRMIRHDATVSVRAGFSRGEAIDLARRAGIPAERTRYRWSLFTHRFTLTAEKP